MIRLEIAEAASTTPTQSSMAIEVRKRGRPARRPAIERAFQANPDRHYMDVAKDLRCNPQTVQRIFRHLRMQKHGIQATIVYREVDKSLLKWIATETENRLNVLLERVAKGVGVVPASEFARWLSFSGIIDLVEGKDADGQPKVLRQKTAQLIADCSQYFKSRGTNPDTEEQQIPGINRKLDVILAVLCKA